MGEERRTRIQELAWMRIAERTRADLQRDLERLGPFVFLNRAVSMEFGAKFWAAVDSQPSIKDGATSEPLERLAEALEGREVLWLHRRADDTGAIRIAASSLIPAVEALAREHGPDILFATEDVRHGFAQDVGEYDSLLTWWTTETTVV